MRTLPARPTGPRPALVAVLLLVLTLVALPLGAFPLVAAAAGPAQPAAAPAAPALLTAPSPTPRATPDPGRPVVFVGMTGVRWDDASLAATPHLFSLVEHGATGNLISRSVRSTSCPVDGWLAVSAGRRAADLPMERYGTCRALLSPGADGVVPGWSDFLQAAEDGPYDAVPGLLGVALGAAGATTAALGPGAAIALAGADGVPVGDRYATARAPSTLATQVAEAVPAHDLTVVDVGGVRDRGRPFVYVDEGDLQDDVDDAADPTPDLPGTDDWLLREPTRAEQVAAIDARLGAVLDTVAEVAPDAVVVVASLSDSGTVPRMQVAAVVEAAELGEDPGVLGSASTRQYGMVQATDVTPTLAHLVLGEPLDGIPGAPMTRTGAAPEDHLFRLVDISDHSLAIRPLVPGFFSFLVAINLLIYGAAALGLNRTFLGRMQAGARRLAPLGRALLRPAGTASLLRALRNTGVYVAAIPLASYLANLLPWWRAANAGLALWGALLAIALAIAVVALAGPWRRHLLAPLAVVAGLTYVVLVVDALTGATLQVSALMGVQPQVGGRFYGFNNSSFALLASSSLLVAMCVAEPLVRRGRRWLAGGLIAVLGIATTILDGHPSIGADFGGPPALIPAFTILVLLTLSVRLTWRRVVLVLGVSALLAVSFSVLDWLRPADQRSHLGNFIQTVLDGGLANVIARKAGQNLTNLFGSTLTLLMLAGVVVLVFVVARPLGRGGGEDERITRRRALAGYDWLSPRDTVGRLTQDAVMLKPGVTALATAWVIGYALNDSGVVVPAIGMSLAVPLLIAVVARWLLRIRVADVPAGEAVTGPVPSRGQS